MVNDKIVEYEYGKFLYFKWTYASELGGFHIAKVEANDLSIGRIIYVDSTSKSVIRKNVGNSVHASGSFRGILKGTYGKVPSKDFGAWERVTESYVNGLLSKEKKPSNEEVCSTTLSNVDSKNASQYAISNQNNQIQYEGNQMKKQEVNVEVRVNGEIVAGNGEKTHKKVFNSDLEMVQTVKRGKHIVVWYDHTGREVSMSYGTAKEAQKELQNPSKLGWTYRIYKISESATTEIPTKSLEV